MIDKNDLQVLVKTITKLQHSFFELTEQPEIEDTLIDSTCPEKKIGIAIRDLTRIVEAYGIKVVKPKFLL